MTQQELEALLGRPLTPIEVTNKGLYLEIAQESLEELLCISLDADDDSGDPEPEARTFEVREGYSTVFTDIFTDVSEVKVDGVVTTDYYPAFWDRRSADYYNSIALDVCSGKEVEITALWGFAEIPSDLKLLLARLFANVSKKYAAGGGNIKNKKVEDFSVSYGDLTDDQVFLDANARTIRKYNMCNIGYIRHGKTCVTHGRYDCGYCL
jgi:hypothetical protein